MVIIILIMPPAYSPPAPRRPRNLAPASEPGSWPGGMCVCIYIYIYLFVNIYIYIYIHIHIIYIYIYIYIWLGYLRCA